MCSIRSACNCRKTIVIEFIFDKVTHLRLVVFLFNAINKKIIFFSFNVCTILKVSAEEPTVRRTSSFAGFFSKILTRECYKSYPVVKIFEKKPGKELVLRTAGSSTDTF